MSTNKIGYYQLNNLIENRVPFIFFNLGEDLAPWFTLMAKMHVENWQVRIDPSQADSQIQADLTERNIPKDFAIVVLCPNGKQSAEITEDLEKKGYTNVYLIDGGYRQMMTDKG